MHPRSRTSRIETRAYDDISGTLGENDTCNTLAVNGLESRLKSNAISSLGAAGFVCRCASGPGLVNPMAQGEERGFLHGMLTAQKPLTQAYH